jgi:5-formyltetrahydrofolate cyclo-ligase
VEKAELRRALRERRHRLADPARPTELAAQLVDLRHALQVPPGPGTALAGFLPTLGEPDVTGCLAGAAAAAELVLVPRTLPGCRMAWVAWTPATPLRPDRHGLSAPTGPAVPDGLARCTVLLVPALAIDLAGTRIGHGAGYYDRALADVPAWPRGPLRVGVVHPAEVLSDPLPSQPHDAPVDAILTAAGWHRAARRTTGSA